MKNEKDRRLRLTVFFQFTTSAVFPFYAFHGRKLFYGIFIFSVNQALGRLIMTFAKDKPNRFLSNLSRKFQDMEKQEAKHKQLMSISSRNVLQ